MIVRTTGRVKYAAIRPNLAKSTLLISLMCLLGACGLTYNPSGIGPIDETELTESNPLVVDVIRLNPDTVNAANTAPYNARQLPKWFQSVAKTPSASTPTNARNPSQPSYEVSTETRLPNDLRSIPYRIGLGDVIIVKTTPLTANEEGAFNGGFQGFNVNLDGMVELPILGAVKVSGLTAEETKNLLQAHSQAQGFNQVLEVRISEYKSARVAISGAVRNPMLASLNDKPLYLDEALLIAGGTTTRSLKNTLIQIYRENETYQILESELYGQRIKKIPLQNDDRINVIDIRNIDEKRNAFDEDVRAIDLQNRLADRAWNQKRAALGDARNNYLTALNLGGVNRDFVYLAGAVTVQGRFTLPFERGAVMADALYFEARGLERIDGDPKHVYLIRGSDDGTSVVAYWLDAQNAANLVMATRLELRPRDIIFGSNQPITNWNRTVQGILPTLGLTSQLLNLPVQANAPQAQRNSIRIQELDILAKERDQ